MLYLILIMPPTNHERFPLQMPLRVRRGTNESTQENMLEEWRREQLKIAEY
jgi:hypothetical protein